MSSSAFIERFQRRLAQLGCPARHKRRFTRELSDHLDDLKTAGVADGLSEAEADVRAGGWLGEPVVLAEHLAAVLRNSSWWGRHPVIGFCWLPCVMLLVMITLALLFGALLGSLCFTAGELHDLAQYGLDAVQRSLAVTYYIAVALTAMLLCYLVKRSASGLKWALASCGILALHGCFCWLRVASRALTFGYSWPPRPDWPAIAIPLAVAGAFVSWHWWTSKVLALATTDGETAAITGEAPRLQALPLPLPRARLVTPSSVIAALLIGALTILGFQVWNDLMRRLARQRDMATRVWPAERAAAVERLKSRWSIPVISGATTIDLKPRLNLRLNEAANPLTPPNENNLAELSEGVHVFGGVPFDVHGRIQLLGRGLIDSGKFFPPRVNKIPVARRCARIHLLHGASFLQDEKSGVTVARMILHYEDGSTAELAIVSGEHLLDWWGPILKDGGKQFDEPSSPGTELAWAGSNAWIRQRRPQASLRLYKSSFDNPQPALALSTVDYVSTMTKAAPFLVGLTVE